MHLTTILLPALATLASAAPKKHKPEVFDKVGTMQWSARPGESGTLNEPRGDIEVNHSCGQPDVAGANHFTIKVGFRFRAYTDNNCTDVIGGPDGQPGEMDGTELKRFGPTDKDFNSYEAWYAP